MKRTPVGFIIKELLITDGERGVMERRGVRGMVKWRERGGEIAKAVQFPARNKDAQAVSLNILSHTVAAVLYFLPEFEVECGHFLYCRSVVVDTCTAPVPKYELSYIIIHTVCFQ